MRAWVKLYCQDCRALERTDCKDRLFCWLKDMVHTFKRKAKAGIKGQATPCSL